MSEEGQKPDLTAPKCGFRNASERGHWAKEARRFAIQSSAFAYARLNQTPSFPGPMLRVAAG
jgi:hypothetical protein